MPNNLASALGINVALASKLIEPEDSGVDEGVRAATRNVARMRDEKRNGKIRTIAPKGSHDRGGPSWIQAHGDQRADRMDRIKTVANVAKRRSEVVAWARRNGATSIVKLHTDWYSWVCYARFPGDKGYRYIEGYFDLYGVRPDHTA